MRQLRGGTDRYGPAYRKVCLRVIYLPTLRAQQHLETYYPIFLQVNYSPNFPPDYERLDDDPAECECPDCEGKRWVVISGEERACPCCQGLGWIPNPDLKD